MIPFLLILLSCLSSGRLRDVLVNPASWSGENIVSVLENLSNNTVVELLPGEYVIGTSVPIKSLYNISIVSNESSAMLSCKGGSGISFTNVHKLTIENVTIISCNANFVPSIVSNIPLNIGSAGLLYSMLMASCSDIVIENVVFSNSSGAGLVVIGAIETVILSEVNFTGNTGGGLIVMSFDLTLQDNTPAATEINISACRFLNNTSSTSPLPSDYESLIGMGGGATFIFWNMYTAVQVNLVRSYFIHNVGEYGGGVHVNMFSGIENSYIQFSECNFQYNSATLQGGGLFLLVPSTQVCMNFSSSDFELTLSSSLFLGNMAEDGGAISVLSLQATSAIMSLYSVTIQNNSALKASAVTIQQGLSESITHSFGTVFTNCTIRNNISPMFPSTSAGALIIDGSKVVHKSWNSITGTTGSAIMIRNGGSMQINGTTLIGDNYGINGGAFHLSDTSKLVLHNNSHLDLINNVALLSGGAIYVHDCVNSECCYIDPLASYFQSCKFDGNFITKINFHGNKAQRGASIFGSTLNCSWITDTYPNFYTACKGKHFMVFGNGRDQFQTPGKLLVNTSDYTTKPGSLLKIPVISRDEFGQSVDDAVTFRIINSSSNISYESTQVINHEYSNTSINVFGEQNESVDVEIVSSQTFSSVHIRVEFAACGTGYWFNETSLRCECLKEFAKLHSFCTLETITTPENIWIGEDRLVNDTLLWGYCSRGYCKKGANVIVESDFDSQCSSNRAGILCSQCLNNLSVVLGSSRTCLDCSNTSIALVLAVLLFGVLMMIGITLCRVDISQGYVTSAIFYCNLLAVCGHNFVPLDWRIVFIGADLLSFKLNLNTCFYAGMTDLGATMIQYGFIGYMILLVFLVCVAVSKVTLPRSHANLPAKVIPTVVLLCQVSLMELCIVSLSYVSIHTFDNKVQKRWLVSPELAYVKSLHAVPFTFALVSVIVLLLPFTLILTYPPCTYRSRFLAKLKPVYDAIWAPFRPKLHWWFIFRLLLRWIVYICAVAFHIEDSNFAVALIFMAMFFLQVRLKPYIKEWHNVLDDGFLLIIVAMAFGGVYFQAFHVDYWLVYSLCLTSCFYATLLAVVIVHFYKILPTLLNDFHLLLQFLRIRLGRCCTRRQQELVELPCVSSTEVTTAGLQEGPDLNDNIVVDTSGAAILDISTMCPSKLSAVCQETDKDPSKKSSLESESLLNGKRTSEEQYYTCRTPEK